jgi:hypothetical protein
MATKKTKTPKSSAAKTPKKTNKSAYVRSLPPSMSAKDVVNKAKEAGIKLTEAYVYTIRSSSKRAGGRRGATPGRPGRPTNASSQDTRFRELALGIGLDRAKALLSEMEGKLRRLIQG